MTKLLIGAIVILLGLLLFLWIRSRGVRRNIQDLRDQVEELVERGASREGEEMRLILHLIEMAAFYCKLWRFDKDMAYVNEATIRLDLQHKIVPPFRRTRRRPPDPGLRWFCGCCH